MTLCNATIRKALAVVLAAAMLMFLIGQPIAESSAARSDIPREYALKLAFLYKFSQYVTADDASAGDEMRVAVFGDNPFGDSLQRLAGRQSQGKKCVPLIIDKPHQCADVDILFVPRSVPRSVVEEIVNLTANRSVLLVGETSGFLDDGGVMNFVLSPEGRLHIFLNGKTARERHLRIDARLLKFCVTVNDE